jgi:hypothetical protein
MTFFSLFFLIQHISGGRLLYLPPYSPDFNPIELSFSFIKSWMRCHYDRAVHHATPLSFIYDACSQVSSSQAWGWYRASGYF